MLLSANEDVVIDFSLRLPSPSTSSSNSRQTDSPQSLSPHQLFGSHSPDGLDGQPPVLGRKKKREKLSPEEELEEKRRKRREYMKAKRKAERDQIGALENQVSRLNQDRSTMLMEIQELKQQAKFLLEMASLTGAHDVQQQQTQQLRRPFEYGEEAA
eukprot:m.186216 g.186216  ORF g.186216 m.186216 type:complete len:157 (-) comp25585_c0_seq4:125-595(-)